MRGKEAIREKVVGRNILKDLSTSFLIEKLNWYVDNEFYEKAQFYKNEINRRKM